MAARSRRALVATLAAFFLTALASAPAHAALSAPAPLAPANGAAVAMLSAFAWTSVAAADHYEFQVAADSGFNSPVLGHGDDDFNTRNTRATLKKTVPNGTYWWRVRAVDAQGRVSAWSAGWSLHKSWTAAAALQNPAGGTTLTFPANPMRLAWSPVAGAAHYLVSLATDPQLGSLVVVDTDSGTNGPPQTAATSFTRGANLAPGTYYWGITPVDAEGNKGAPSRVTSFNWAWPSTTTPRVIDLNDAPEVFDPQFSWDPVPGAARYEVEINSTQAFAPGSKVCCSQTTIATSLAPTNVFKDNTYYWRVRAIDPDGNTGVWNVGPSFVKAFDKVPPVATPSVKNLHLRDNLLDPGTDADPAAGYQTTVPMMVWDPVAGAASYEVEVTPFNELAGTCDWTAPAHHWRVETAVPAWTPLGSQWNLIKPYPDDMEVANDFVTLVPGKYCARVRARSDRAGFDDVYGAYTYLDPSLLGWAFEWTGYPSAGACTPSCNPGYLGANDYVTPQTGTVTARTPYFTWKPLSGRQSYFVIIAKDPDFSNIVDYAFTQLPAYSPRTSFGSMTYADETSLYYWVVLPATGFDGSGAAGNPLQGAARSFQKQSVPPALISPAAGTVFNDQPRFRWSPAEGARRYRLQVAQDPSFGNPIDDVTTDSTAYSSNTTYPADTVLYWRVRADDENLVGLNWSATGTFQKRLPTPVPSAANPVAGEFLPSWTWNVIQGATSYDVSVDLPDGTHKDINGLRMPVLTPIKMTGTGVFHWKVRANFPQQGYGEVHGPYSAMQAFTRTIAEPTLPHTDAGPDRLLLSWNPKVGVKNYRLQIAARPDFGLTVEDVTTDNASYAPKLEDISYLNGSTLYWRVAGVDELNNQGDWTPTQQFSLLPKLKLKVSGRLRKRRRSRVTATVTNAAGSWIQGVSVRALGAGVKRQTRLTNVVGSATFRLRPRRRGRVAVIASKAGYQGMGVVLIVR